MPDALRLAWRQYRLERRMFWRNPSAAFFNLLLPLLFLVLVGAVFRSGREVIVPGIAGMSVMTTTFTALAFNMTFLREQGILKRVRGTPLPAGSYLAGIAASVLTNTALQIVVVVAVGHYGLGVGWPPRPGELVAFTFAGAVCFASLGVALSHVIPSFDSAPVYVNVIFLPAIFVSGVFYPASDAPRFLRDIAAALPLKHLVDGLSSAMVSGRPLEANLSALAVLGLWTALGSFLAVRGFSWGQERA